MKNIKVGDKVKFNDGNQNGVGEVVGFDRYSLDFLVNSEDIVNGHNGGSQNNTNNWWILGKHLDLAEPKQDLRELLQVGQKIRNEYQTEFIGNEIHLRDLKSRFNENLYSDLSKTTIDEIYRKKYNGIKPMEWVLVWKREEELFSLRLKGNVRLPYYAKGNSKTKYDYTFRKNNKPVNEEKYQVRFTQEDIEKLPKELVALLEKEKVQ